MSKLNNLIKEINKKHKDDLISVGIAELHTEIIPFTSPRLNYMLYGGLPRGRLIEFAGEEASGKTTTALDIVGNAQKVFNAEQSQGIEELEKVKGKSNEARKQYLQARGPKRVVYADCENTLDEDWAKLLGVNVKDLIVFKPKAESAEEIFEILLQMIETDEVGLVVIDSLGVMLSAQAYDKTIGEKTYGGIAQALTTFSKKAEMACARYGCTLLGINQLRDNLNSVYGGTQTVGGRAWRHNCSVRLQFRKGSFIDEMGTELNTNAENPSGNKVLVNIVKTKVCKPNRRLGFYTLHYRQGIDKLSDLIDIGIRIGAIEQAGAWYSLIDLDTGEVLVDEKGVEIKMQGRARLIQFLENNTKELKKLETYVAKTYIDTSK